MKKINTYIIEKLRISKDSKNQYNYEYTGTIGDNFYFDSIPFHWKNSINKIINHFDKKLFNKYSCTNDELNKGCSHNNDDWVNNDIKKHNKLAKIIELWPANLVPDEGSSKEKIIDLDLLNGIIDKNDLKVEIRKQRKDSKKIIVFIESTKNGCEKVWFLFKKK